MATNCFRLVIAALVTVCPSLSQQVAKPSGMEVYRHFFQQVVAHDGVNEPPVTVSFNGGVAKYRVPTLQEAIGLTDGQASLLLTEATKCLKEIEALEAEIRPFLFAARMDAIASEQAATVLAARMRDLNRQIEEAIARSVGDLRDALGQEPFKAIEASVSAAKNPWQMFPIVPIDDSIGSPSLPKHSR